VSDKTNKSLKPGWRQVKFGDVVRQCKEKVDPATSGLDRYVAGDHMDTDSLRLSRWGEIGSGYLGPAFHIRFRPGQVLYGSRRTYLRKVAVADFEGICANTTFVLEPKSSAELLPELLPFLMQTENFNTYSVKNSKGSVNPYINFSDLAEFAFQLPPSDQQVRLLQVLSAAEAVIEAHDRAVDALRTTRASIVEDVLAECFDAEATEPLGGFLRDLSYGSSARSSYVGSGYPILRIPNVLRGRVDYSDLQRIELNQAEYERAALGVGDVLIVRTNGNPQYVGRSVAIDGLPEKTVFASYLIRLRCKETRMRPAFLAELLNAPSTRQRLRGEVKSSAGNYNISTAGIKKLQVCVPEVTIQDTLLTALQEVDNAIEAQATRSFDSRSTKKQLLAELQGA